jgi:hypothetical protein
MAFDAHLNLVYATIATAPTPAASGTSLVLSAGAGAGLPTVPFNATIWPAGVQAFAANAEIIRVTARATDTLTITRAQEGSTARAIVVGDQFAATVTAKTLTDVEAAAVGPVADARLSANVALLNQVNTFTQTQILQANVAGQVRLKLWDMTQPVDARKFELLNYAQQLYIQALNDAESTQAGVAILSRQGSLALSGDVTEKNRTTPMGHWLDVPFNPANFAASGGMTLTVAAGNIAVNRYTLIGKTLIWNLYITNATLSGASDIALYLYPPAGFTYPATAQVMGMINLAGGWGTALVAVGGGYLTIYRGDTTIMPLGSVYVSFQIALEIA